MKADCRDYLLSQEEALIDRLTHRLLHTTSPAKRVRYEIRLRRARARWAARRLVL